MLKKICTILNTIWMALLLIIAALLFVPKCLGYTQYAVVSGSMEPGIPVGAIVYDKDVDLSKLQVGDVITYRLHKDTLVTHRVAAINQAAGTVTTKGDANETADGSPVPFEAIIGVRAFQIPWLGFLSIYGKTPLGIAVVCGLLILLILLNFLPELLSEEENKREDHKRVENKKEESMDI